MHLFYCIMYSIVTAHALGLWWTLGDILKIIDDQYKGANFLPSCLNVYYINVM